MRTQVWRHPLLVPVIAAMVLLAGGGVAGATGTATADATAVATQDTTFTYPTRGQQNVDATTPFTWAAVPAAQGYAVAVGTTRFGTDLAQSGVLPNTQTSYQVAALPTGKRIYATILTEHGGTWGYTAVTFTATPGDAFTYPTEGQTNVDIFKPFTWSAAPESEGSILALGMTPFSANVYNSGLLPAGQNSVILPPYISGHVYATLLTKTNGGYTRYQAIAFTAAPAIVTIVNSYPLTVRISLDNRNFVLAPGQRVAPVRLIAPNSGNDNTTISVVSDPGCGLGDDYNFFESGRSYTFTVVAGLGTCANGTAAPNFVITPV